MADASIDVPRVGRRGVEPAPAPHGIGYHVAIVAMSVAIVAVVGVVVWARFLTGLAAGPVPAGPVDPVPALAPQAAAVPGPGGTASASAASGASAASAAQAVNSGAGSAAASALSSAASAASSSAASAAAASAAAASAAAKTDASPQALPTLPAPRTGVASSVEPPVDPAWLDRTAAATGIPRRALQAYAGADLELLREEPACGLGWNTLAGIGDIESGHGRDLGPAGYASAPILGPPVAGGVRAEGPMQFLPSTWKRWGADGNGDGVADPNQIDDAALAAGRYLCSYGGLDTSAGWHTAVFGYNHLDSYVASVAAQAVLYAQRAGS
ncbi:MAG TPA: lytic transglycosylase domain-containing protein [Gryllotalpicola sp.]